MTPPFSISPMNWHDSLRSSVSVQRRELYHYWECSPQKTTIVSWTLRLERGHGEGLAVESHRVLSQSEEKCLQVFPCLFLVRRPWEWHWKKCHFFRRRDLGMKAPGLGMQICVRAFSGRGMGVREYTSSRYWRHWLCTKASVGQPAFCLEVCQVKTL